MQGSNLLHWPIVDQLFPRRSFDQLYCLGPYVWPISTWIKQLKYYHRFELAVAIAHLLTPLWQKHLSLTLTDHWQSTAVPIHPKKWLQRGYNQAHLIAKQLSQNVSTHYQTLIYNSELLLRNEFSVSQVGQTGRQRRQNLQRAFAIHPSVTSLPKHIVIVDDVITTGSTVNAISRLLKEQGVNTVSVLTLALTLPQITGSKH